jgi:uncharacterized membrane protein
LGLFSWFIDKPHFNTEEKERVVEAIRMAEKRTSGEIRIYVESRCRFVDAVDRAYELFFALKMDKTHHRNGVLIYIAIKDHQLAIFGDEGIYTALGKDFWENEVNLMLRAFHKGFTLEILLNVIADVGEALTKHFPYIPTEDKNELPDDIIFGA